jgi:four helix bundle protein
MPRLSQELLDRTEDLAHRVMDVAEAIEMQRRSRRVVDQLAGCGTSVGANTAEAAEAISRKDFAKTLGIVLKELAETRFWLRFVGRRGWIDEPRLIPLHDETAELKRIFGSMLARIRRADQTDDAPN